MVGSEDVEERIRAIEELKNNFAILEDKKQAWKDLIRLTSDTSRYVRMRVASTLESAFSLVQDKKQAWDDLHRLTFDADNVLRLGVASVFRNAFSLVPDKKQAWDDLIRFTFDTDRYVRWGATDALGNAFSHVSDKKQAWDDLIRLTSNIDSDVRLGVASALGNAFFHVPDRKQAWNDLHKLTSNIDSDVRWGVASALGNAFSHMPDKKQAWDDLIKLTSDTNRYVRQRAASAIGSAFSHVPNKKQAWEYLHRFTSDNESIMCRGAIDALGSAFSHVSDKKQAWDDLHRLTSDNDGNVRLGAAYALRSVFSHVSDKNQAWDDLHRLTSDNDSYVRGGAASALGSAFSHVPDRKQAWNDLHRLTSDNDSDVRVFANHSSGKVCISMACEAESEDGFRNEMENALGFFEKASMEATLFNPAKFCLPFYRSFYTLTFKKEDVEAEVQRYISEAKSAVQGSESKEKLLEAVENLGHALKEAQKARDLNARKTALNACRRYLDRACELLDTTEEKAPGASRLIRKGLPIIDERIKRILAEIEGNTTALCKQTKGTQLDNFGRELYCQGHNLSQIGDPIKLDKEISGMQNTLTMLCGRLIEENIIEELEILNKINDERYVENKVEMMDTVMRRILNKVKSMKKIDVKISGNDNKINIDSVDNSINIKGDLTTDLETLSALIERDYKQDDRNDVLQTVNQMKQSCNDSSKKNWIKQKLGWIISRTSEVASISSFAITLLQNVK